MKNINYAAIDSILKDDKLATRMFGDIVVADSASEANALANALAKRGYRVE